MASDVSSVRGQVLGQGTGGDVGSLRGQVLGQGTGGDVGSLRGQVMLVEAASGGGAAGRIPFRRMTGMGGRGWGRHPQVPR